MKYFKDYASSMLTYSGELSAEAVVEESIAASDQYILGYGPFGKILFRLMSSTSIR